MIAVTGRGVEQAAERHPQLDGNRRQITGTAGTSIAYYPDQ